MKNKAIVVYILHVCRIFDTLGLFWVTSPQYLSFV